MKMRFRDILLVMCVSLCLFSGWKVYSILDEYRQGEKSYENLTYQYLSDAPQDGDSVIPDRTSPATNSTSHDTELCAEPIEAAPVVVDFGALLDTCPDIVGWIYSPDTPINYPIVQTGDNEYYLRRLLDGTWNSNGSIFMDYRSAGNFSDWNTVIYGHNMKNDSMFGTLEDYKEQEYYDAHPILYLLTPSQNYKIELIGGYTTSGKTTNLTGFPKTQAERDELIATARQHTTFLSTVEVRDEERIITLSTCAYDYDNARYVLVGVLREIA